MKTLRHDSFSSELEERAGERKPIGHSHTRAALFSASRLLTLANLSTGVWRSSSKSSAKPSGAPPFARRPDRVEGRAVPRAPHSGSHLAASIIPLLAPDV